MKTTKNFKRVALFGVLTATVFGYQAINLADSSDLNKLVSISNASASESGGGGVACGPPGRGCKYTLTVGDQKYIIVSETHQEAPDQPEE